MATRPPGLKFEVGRSFPMKGFLILSVCAAALAAQGTISYARYRHEPLRQAVKEFHKARKAAARERNGEAIASLEKAVRIDPRFFEAQNNLGVRRFIGGQYGAALEAFQRAWAIDSGSPEVAGNVAAALLALRRPSEAEWYARESIALGGRQERARYLMALSLLGQGKDKKHAVELLEAAAPRFAPARLALAGLVDGSQ
jgi:Flp pilus assembly protein TadD